MSDRISIKNLKYFWEKILNCDIMLFVVHKGMAISLSQRSQCIVEFSPQQEVVGLHVRINQIANVSEG